jgi:hypothetical protein
MDERDIRLSDFNSGSLRTNTVPHQFQMKSLQSYIIFLVLICAY